MAMVGQSASFTVVAVGAEPLHYQWWHDGVQVGADAADYAIAAVQIPDGGSYTVAVSDNVSRVTSEAATLVIQPANSHPISGVGRGAGRSRDCERLRSPPAAASRKSRIASWISRPR